MSNSAVLTIPGDEPFLAGHFPNNPIVPGVVILERIAEQILSARAQPMVISAVRAAKFLSPLKPGESLILEWMAETDDTVRFQCRTGERRIAEGILQVDACP